MKFYTRFLAALCLSVSLLFFAGTVQAAFEPIRGIDEASLEQVAISPVNPQFVAIASQNRLYLSRDGGDDFRRISEFRDSINYLSFDAGWPEVIYVATGDGLFRVENGREDRIYSTERREEVLAMNQHRGKTYIGTTRGLFVSTTEDWSWREIRARETRLAVMAIEPCQNRILFATNDGIYSINLLTEDVEQLYSIGRSQPYEEIERLLEEGDDIVEAADDEGHLVPLSLKVNIFDPSLIFLGTNEGVYHSTDAGGSWDKFSIRGMGNIAVHDIAQTPNSEGIFYAATPRGLFEVQTKTAESTELYRGLTTSDIRSVAASPAGKIYVATRRGAFRADDFHLASGPGVPGGQLALGPGIQEVHEAAMRYNHAHPQRIENWYDNANRRAWYPDLTLRFSGDEEEIARGSTTDPETDRYLRAPRGYDWQVTFSWDFADLIYDSEQRQIGSTARLIQRERRDLLEEVNRVFFERRRLVMELDEDDLDSPQAIQDRLRVEELTATLDAYTGGFFSRRLAQMRR